MSSVFCALQNQLSGYLLRKFKNSNGWQRLWVIFTNFCLFFYKNFQVIAVVIVKVTNDLEQCILPSLRKHRPSLLYVGTGFSPAFLLPRMSPFVNIFCPHHPIPVSFSSFLSLENCLPISRYYMLSSFPADMTFLSFGMISSYL